MDRSPHSKRRKKIREILMAARLKVGLNQTQLAKRLNIRQTLVSDVETGLRQLDVIEWLDYCEALELKPAVVLKELG